MRPDVPLTTAAAPALRRAADAFRDSFSHDPEAAVRAPGRVNLIGEHTDYNDGFVLPIAIDLATVMVFRRSTHNRCRVVATDCGGEVASFLSDDSLAPGRVAWANYIKGVVRQFIDHGHTPPGFDAAVASSLPIGGGLSSSAALEVATATLLEHLLDIRLDPMVKARWCQKAEHTFAGAPVGVMDPTASILGRQGAALLLDCRSLQVTPVPLEDPALAIIVSNTNVQHELSTGEYALRRQQCADALSVIRRTHSNITALRDATLEHLEEYRNVLDDVLYRRAHHVVTENQRTLRAATALAQRDYISAGRLLNESHRSLRDDYEVSCDELDIMADLAQCFHGVYGSRMTGGGFGGSTVTLVHADAADPLIEHLSDAYPRRTGRHATCFRVSPAQGACLLTDHPAAPDTSQA